MAVGQKNLEAMLWHKYIRCIDKLDFHNRFFFNRLFLNSLKSIGHKTSLSIGRHINELGDNVVGEQFGRKVQTKLKRPNDLPCSLQLFARKTQYIFSRAQ